MEFRFPFYFIQTLAVVKACKFLCHMVKARDSICSERITRLESPKKIIYIKTSFIILFVTEPPRIHTVYPTDQSVNETESIHIFCNATGKPPPIVTWSKLGENNKVFLPGNSLVVQQAEKSDFGQYQCTASTIRGDNHSALATVKLDNCKLDNPTKPTFSQLVFSFLAIF